MVLILSRPPRCTLRNNTLPSPFIRRKKKIHILESRPRKVHLELFSLGRRRGGGGGIPNFDYLFIKPRTVTLLNTYRGLPNTSGMLMCESPDSIIYGPIAVG